MKLVPTSENIDKLVGVAEVDHEKVRQLARVHEEIEQIKKRSRFLMEIAQKHSELNEYLWRTKDGRYMLVHDMQDDHLKNAVNYTIKHRGHVPFVLQQEYYKRFNETPTGSGADDGEGSVLSESKKSRRQRYYENDWGDEDAIF